MPRSCSLQTACLQPRFRHLADAAPPEISLYPPLLLSAPDAAKLRALVRSGHLRPSDKTPLSRLLWACAVARKDDDTFDRICLYDQVTLVSTVDSEDLLRLTVVLPEEEDAENCQLAVTNPISRAVLGRRCGERVTWKAPRGLRRMLIAALAKSDPVVR